MKLVILGPQGCGKGTQAEMISKELDLVHISTGDIFRDNIRHHTKLGEMAQKIIEKGDLIPDKLTTEIIHERISHKDCEKGFILDGFPRDIEQINLFEKFQNVDKAIYIHIDDKESIHRISGRRSCPEGHVYHITSNPPKKEGICDVDGKQLYQRDDDKPDVINERLSVYHKLTEPLIKFYENEGVLIRIDGNQDIKKVFSDIIKLLK